MDKISIERLLVKVVYGDYPAVGDLEAEIESDFTDLDKLLAEDTEISKSRIDAIKKVRDILFKEDKEEPDSKSLEDLFNDYNDTYIGDLSLADSTEKEEYKSVISYVGYSDDTSLSTVSALTDSLSQSFKESLENLDLLEDESLEQVKISITLYTKNKEQELVEPEPVEYNGEFIKVESSNVDSVAYDKENKKILVKFKQGTLYSYEDCEEEDFKYIINATSVGSAFSDFKKGHTRYSRLK